MKRDILRQSGAVVIGAALVFGAAAGAGAQTTVRTTAGSVQGAAVANGTIRVFKGVPFAAPPVGELRWQAPRAVRPWEGVRDATAFGPACAQGKIFGDINFSDVREDCLSLNVWTPARSAGERLPVMVWIHGGGYMAGGGAEPRHDGEAFAKKGVVLVTINYRLGIFGFFSHPELTKESGRGASGNYGLLDQVAALQWVHDNIAAFGGNPNNVTIFGESAGSFSVSALVASPLTSGLVQKAIGESGAFFSGAGGTLAAPSRDTAEQAGAKFATSIGCESLAALRAKPTEELLQAAAKARFQAAPSIDGYFLPQEVEAIYAAGKQQHVPLLAGWNADEMRMAVTLRPQKPTAQSFADDVRTRFGVSADEVLKYYPTDSPEATLESAAAFASDMFISYATWKWIEAHLQTGGSPVYRYSFDRKIPVEPDAKMMGTPVTARDIGARHAGEIEYVFGTLERSLPKVPWEAADRALSDAMTTYWANFARTGNPSGAGVSPWPRYDGATRRVLHLDTSIKDAADAVRPRYLALDAAAKAQAKPTQAAK
jgi:para-nitrobenzyl esterase